MMTIKDHKLIAEGINTAVHKLKDEDHENDVCINSVQLVVNEIANALQNDSKAFNREKFLEACFNEA